MLDAENQRMGDSKNASPPSIGFGRIWAACVSKIPSSVSGEHTCSLECVCHSVRSEVSPRQRQGPQTLLLLVTSPAACSRWLLLHSLLDHLQGSLPAQLHRQGHQEEPSSVDINRASLRNGYDGFQPYHRIHGSLRASWAWLPAHRNRITLALACDVQLSLGGTYLPLLVWP